MAEKEYILIKGAREHNLKNIDVEIPLNKLVVITGLSGSGKSSLAFDTIYAEVQRRGNAGTFVGIRTIPSIQIPSSLMFA